MSFVFGTFSNTAVCAHSIVGLNCTQAPVYCSVFISSWAWALLVSLRVQTQKQSSNIVPVGNHTLLYSFLCMCMCVHVHVCAWASFPFTSPFVWVSVSSVVCRQAPIVLNCCSLLTQGPWHFVFPWPPSHRRTEGWNQSPGSGKSLFALPFLYLGDPGAIVGWTSKI